MGLNMVLVKAAMLLFLMGFTATVDARFNPSSFVTQLLMNGNAVTDTKYYFANSLASDACCDSCKCTRSIPPQCQCYDIRETCHSACKACFCALTYPPKCSCFDVNDFCYKSCSGAKTHKEQGMNQKVSISDVANVI